MLLNIKVSCAIKVIHANKIEVHNEHIQLVSLHIQTSWTFNISGLLSDCGKCFGYGFTITSHHDVSLSFNVHTVRTLSTYVVHVTSWSFYTNQGTCLLTCLRYQPCGFTAMILDLCFWFRKPVKIEHPTSWYKIATLNCTETIEYLQNKPSHKQT